MLKSITIALLVLWVIGLASSYAMGGLIHLFVIAAVVVWDISLLQDARP